MIPKTIARVSIDAKEITTALENWIFDETLPTISLDEVYIRNADNYLSVTRITNPTTGSVSIGSRVCNGTIAEQIRKLPDYDKVVLADIGAFEGKTLQEICSLIERRGIEVERVLLGVAGVSSVKKTNRDMRIVKAFNFYEWIELRDFLGIDGRKTGNRAREFMPYWENPTEWASIPEQNTQMLKELCLEYNKKLLEILKRDRKDISKIGKWVKWRCSK